MKPESIEEAEEELRRLGFVRDAARMGWYHPASSIVDSGTKRKRRLYFPPFGITDSMLYIGWRLWDDAEGRVLFSKPGMGEDHENEGRCLGYRKGDKMSRGYILFSMELLGALLHLPEGVRVVGVMSVEAYPWGVGVLIEGSGLPAGREVMGECVPVYEEESVGYARFSHWMEEADEARKS